MPGSGTPPGIAAWGRRGTAPPSPSRPGGDGGGIPLVQSVFNVFPPWLYPPASAIRFNTRAFDITAPGVGVVTPLPMTPLVQWGQGVHGTLNSYEIGVSSAVPAMDVFFTILFNGAPIPGLDRLRTAVGTAALVLFGDSPFAVFGQSGELTMTVTNNSAGAFVVQGQLAGWTYSESDVTQTAQRGVYIPQRA